MKGLREKFQKNGGFTLIEMLIVVAIIAILIAVSIPLVANALEKARDATDQANERAAKAEGTLVYMKVVDSPAADGSNTGTFYYDAVNGKLVSSTEKPTKPYGQCTGNGCSDYPNSGDHTASILEVTISEDASADSIVTVKWTTTP